MSLSADQVADILRRVVHPAIGKDILELEMVRNLQVSDEKIALALFFHKSTDPMKNAVKRAVEAALKELTDQNVEVSFATPSETSAKGQEDTPLGGIKNIIAVASGKGGVGKSTVAVNLAVAFANAGLKTGLVDADIFGPSVPKMMNAENERPVVHKVNGKDLIIPVVRYGVKVLSIGFFVNPDDATIWRGPMASNALKQMITEADWGGLDYLFIDLPPGTSDIHLTLVQTVSVTGAVIVSTPQQVALADVIKGISMFRNESIDVPVLGLIENMAWFTPEELPNNKYYIFGRDGCRELADRFDIPLLGQIPLVQSISESGDEGKPVVLQQAQVGEAFKKVADNLVREVLKRNSGAGPTRRVEITTHRPPVQY